MESRRTIKEEKQPVVIQMMPLRLHNYMWVGAFKSIRRAIRRGDVTDNGTLVPGRPYNNRANTSNRKGTHSRVINQDKRNIYDNLMRMYSYQVKKAMKDGISVRQTS